MSDFGKFFDDEAARHKAERDAQSRVETDKLQAKKDRQAALAKPMRDIVDPVIAQAQEQLASRNLEIEVNPADAIGRRELGVVVHAFRLKAKTGYRLNTVPSVYCFCVHADGRISGLQLDSRSDYGNTDARLFDASPGEVSQDMVENVIKRAISEVAGKLIQTS
jgi:hypothetical protein